MVGIAGMLDEISWDKQKSVHLVLIIAAQKNVQVDDSRTGLETTQFTKTQIVTAADSTPTDNSSLLSSLLISVYCTRHWKAKVEGFLEL